jgi:hypothetical protein
VAVTQGDENTPHAQRTAVGGRAMNSMRTPARAPAKRSRTDFKTDDDEEKVAFRK